MTSRLSPLDTAFWSLEARDAPLHIGALAGFSPAPAGGPDLDPQALAALLADRAGRIPRLRQRVRPSRHPLEGPSWEDQPDFDPAAHVHVHRLEDGDEESAVAALMAAPVPREAPPWEIHVLVPAEEAAGFRLLLKVHHAAVDGLRALDLGVRLFDQFADAPPRAPRTPRPNSAPPRPRPSLLGVIPVEARRVLRAAELAADALLATAEGVERALLHPSPLRPAPLPTAIPGLDRAPEQTTLALPSLPLDDVHLVRKAHGGTVNDVLLAVLAGALRTWGETSDVRVLVPVSERARPGDRHGGAGGNRLSGYLVDLPVSEPDPVERLRLVRAAMDARKRRGPRRGAGAVALLAELLPASGHQLAAPLLRPAAPLLFDALVTNVPLPDFGFTLGGHGLASVHPLPPLAQRQRLAVAISSYRNRVNLGLRGRFPGPEGEVNRTTALGHALDDALAELLATTR